MAAETKYKRNPDFIFRSIADEMVLVPVRSNTANLNDIFTLNGVGAFIWQQLEKPAAMPELQQALETEYEVDPELLAQDLAEFLEEMVSIGAILRD